MWKALMLFASRHSSSRLSRRDRVYQSILRSTIHGLRYPPKARRSSGRTSPAPSDSSAAVTSARRKQPIVSAGRCRLRPATFLVGIGAAPTSRMAALHALAIEDGGARRRVSASQAIGLRQAQDAVRHLAQVNHRGLAATASQQSAVRGDRRTGARSGRMR